ncbi:hypothetical protein, partial [Flavihumibacter sp. CACIAM 22H1]|uniref:hypothetical protein n=1 Tax=Flavihumibacter sp. CACIAM 22H1 TaxID=1812911 RepID=UPI0007A8862A
SVITCDIVNSTKLTSTAESTLLTALEKLLKRYTFEFYRGDSFQFYLKPKDVTKSLQVALLCRTTALRIPATSPANKADLRISIGIGRIEGAVKKLATAKGEAFVLSGRGLDNLSKTPSRLLISVEKENIVRYSFDLIAAYTDSIFNNMTAKQAEVISLLLQGKTQADTVKTLKKSKSTISQRANSAKWSEIEWILKMFNNLINELP